MSEPKLHSIIKEFELALDNTPSSKLRAMTLTELLAKKEKLTHRVKTLKVSNLLQADALTLAEWDLLVEDVLVYSSFIKSESRWAFTLFTLREFDEIQSHTSIAKPNETPNFVHMPEYDIVIVRSNQFPTYKNESEFKTALEACYKSHLRDQIKNVIDEIAAIEELIVIKKAA